ncbi:flagellar brake domain-containing protein [Alteribacillus sp. JSM 102045]|uniref:flagellar brake domain-containing protein n=1 Tax=Alteribacillus sp. JSM 102045 TaxID=1562101 RepID=UPI0035C1EA9E
MIKKNVVFLLILLLMKRRGKQAFLEGTQLSAWFIGTDQAVYSFETEGKGRQKDKIKVILISDPGRIQRRNYVRIDASIDVAVHPLNNDFSPFLTSTLDIRRRNGYFVASKSFLERKRTHKNIGCTAFHGWLHLLC